MVHIFKPSAFQKRKIKEPKRSRAEAQFWSLPFILARPCDVLESQGEPAGLLGARRTGLPPSFSLSRDLESWRTGSSLGSFAAQGAPTAWPRRILLGKVREFQFIRYRTSREWGLFCIGSPGHFGL